MGTDLGLLGLAIVVAMALTFGVVAQLILGRGGQRPWMWIAGTVGWIVGALLMSEVVFTGVAVETVQPVIDGLALDESMLGGLIGGTVAAATLAVLTPRRVHEAPAR